MPREMRRKLQFAIACPRVHLEGIVTLGMIDIHDGTDEDYLLPVGDAPGSGLALRGGQNNRCPG